MSSASSSDEKACAVPIEEQMHACLDHYEKVTLGREWNNQVPQAIRAWYAAKAGTMSESANVPPVPRSNDGEEQHEFEAWAKAAGYDMAEHPLHWLFLNEKTYHAREGWRSALEYVERVLKNSPVRPSTTALPPHGAPDVRFDKQRECNDCPIDGCPHPEVCREERERYAAKYGPSRATNDQSAAPHRPAAFINAISEEGDKAEAIKALQETWNDYCEANAAAKRWYEAASPYATPEALKEALARSATSFRQVGQVHHAMANDGKCGPYFWTENVGALPDGTGLFVPDRSKTNAD